MWSLISCQSLNDFFYERYFTKSYKWYSLVSVDNKANWKCMFCFEFNDEQKYHFINMTSFLWRHLHIQHGDTVNYFIQQCFSFTNAVMECFHVMNHWKDTKLTKLHNFVTYFGTTITSLCLNQFTQRLSVNYAPTNCSSFGQEKQCGFQNFIEGHNQAQVHLVANKMTSNPKENVAFA